MSRIAVVVSQFNLPITQALYEGAVHRLKQRGIEAVQSYWVPGCVEIPLTAQTIIAAGHADAVIALGAVIRGETSHYDAVCQQVSWGCTQVALKTGKPVIFGVLTTENRAQAEDRVGGAHGHKGIDAANAACDMLAVLDSIQGAGDDAA